MISKKIEIHIKESDGKRLIGINLGEIALEDAISIMSVCLSRIQDDCELRSCVSLTRDDGKFNR